MAAIFLQKLSLQGRDIAGWWTRRACWCAFSGRLCRCALPLFAQWLVVQGCSGLVSFSRVFPLVWSWSDLDLDYSLVSIIGCILFTLYFVIMTMNTRRGGQCPMHCLHQTIMGNESVAKLSQSLVLWWRNYSGKNTLSAYPRRCACEK